MLWQEYFDGWINTPDPEVQMLASVMFDLRPIGGDENLFKGLQQDTLERAADNSIFVAHMIANSLKHTPPLGLLRGIATIRSGEHKNQLDMKHNGVVPVVDLGRAYAFPYTHRFAAVDLASIRTNPKNPALRVVNVVLYGRWCPVSQVPVLIDCIGSRRADLALNAVFEDDGSVSNAVWYDMAADDPLGLAACKER